MKTQTDALIRETLRKGLIVPVFYHEDYEVCEAVISICFEEGIEMFEFTNRGDMAAENFERLQNLMQSSYPEKFLGIGTIKTVQDAEKFIKLQPAFVVSPIVNTDVAAVCRSTNIPWMPGCMTPTEVQLASENGASVIKIFPANVVGPAFVKAIKAVFPDIYIMPTGGISADKSVLQQWFDAGVLCVGMGSELLDRDLLKHKKWNELRQKIKSARQLALSSIT